jgi:hypothetical protein
MASSCANYALPTEEAAQTDINKLQEINALAKFDLSWTIQFGKISEMPHGNTNYIHIEHTFLKVKLLPAKNFCVKLIESILI